jgi:Ferritin-like domain
MNPQTRARERQVAASRQFSLLSGSRRAEFMKRAMLVGGAGIAGAMIAGSPRSTDAAQLSQPDLRALNLLLMVEYTESAFYDDAIRRKRLDGELLDYARTVAAQEKEHLDFVRSALAAWIRSIVGQPPASEALDAPKSADQVLNGLRQAGLRR